MGGSRDLVAYRRLGDGGPEVVLGSDRRGNRLPQQDWLGGGFHGHFVFGLFVFLDTEACWQAVRKLEVINAKHRVIRQQILALEASVFVGGDLAGENFFAARVNQVELERAAREFRSFARAQPFIVRRSSYPDLVVHRLSGTIDGTIRDPEGLDLLMA
jgi:hypothetical protein